MKRLALILSSLIAVNSAGAAVLLGTNFDGRVLSSTTSTNNTAGSLNWTTNGIADPGDLTASEGVALANGFDQFRANGLFDAGDNVNRFAPNLNIHNEGSWYVDVPIKVLGSTVQIDNVSLDAFTLNNGGAVQGVGRDLDISVSLTDASDTSLGVLSIDDVFLQAAPAPPQPTPVLFETGGLMVPAGDYNMRLTFSADNLVGNNAGFDNLTVNGSVIPEPSASLLLLLGAALGLRRRR